MTQVKEAEMNKLHTHYSNLMVARNAPSEVIRSSYIALSKKYHPDLNPNNKDATKIMKFINSSYDVLSDPIKRKIHDEWILEKESESVNSRQNNFKQQEPNMGSQTNPEQPIQKSKTAWSKVFEGLRTIFLLCLRNPRLSFSFTILVLILINSNNNSHENKDTDINTAIQAVSHSNTPTSATTANNESREAKDSYTRPLNAPNGLFWPDNSGYLRGYEVHCANGLSKLKVDNSQNQRDVYVKLVDLSIGVPVTARHSLIKSGDTFTFNEISKGEYQLRYMDLDSGYFSKSEKFSVNEIRNENSISSSRLSVTIHRVRNGNFKTENISQEEFSDSDLLTKESEDHNENEQGSRS